MSLNGLSIVTKKGLPFKPITGLRGVVLVLSGTALPIFVSDGRGRPLQGVTVTVGNPGGDSSSGFTDANGNVVLEINGVTPNPVTVQKDNAFVTVDYTGATDNMVIVLEPPYDL